MKKSLKTLALFIVTLTLVFVSTSAPVFSHTIQGTLVLKGRLKTDRVDGSRQTCKIKIEEVKNLLLQDSFGNPAYKVLVAISVGKYQRTLWFNNLFQLESGTSIVKDLEYHASNAPHTMSINSQGRIKNIKIKKNSSHYITCHFIR